MSEKGAYAVELRGSKSDLWRAAESAAEEHA